MTWATLVPLILQYGLPVVEKLWTLISSGKEPTQADWDALNLLANQTPRSQVLAAAARAGIPETDPRVVAMLAAIPA